MKQGELKSALLGLAALENTIESTRELGSDFEEEYMNAVAERTKLRTKIVAAFDVLQARNRELEDVLVEAQRAIATLNEDALGRDTMYGYPYRDELLTRIDVALEKDK